MWKERAKEILDSKCIKSIKIFDILYCRNKGIPNWDKDDLSQNISDAMLQLAKEVHEKACEEQKKICANNLRQNLFSFFPYENSQLSILNSPNAKFEE